MCVELSESREKRKTGLRTVPKVEDVGSESVVEVERNDGRVIAKSREGGARHYYIDHRPWIRG